MFSVKPKTKACRYHACGVDNDHHITIVHIHTMAFPRYEQLGVHAVPQHQLKITVSSSLTFLHFAPKAPFEPFLTMASNTTVENEDVNPSPARGDGNGLSTLFAATQNGPSPSTAAGGGTGTGALQAVTPGGGGSLEASAAGPSSNESSSRGTSGDEASGEQQNTQRISNPPGIVRVGHRAHSDNESHNDKEDRKPAAKDKDTDDSAEDDDGQDEKKPHQRLSFSKQTFSEWDSPGEEIDYSSDSTEDLVANLIADGTIPCSNVASLAPVIGERAKKAARTVRRKRRDVRRGSSPIKKKPKTSTGTRRTVQPVPKDIAHAMKMLNKKNAVISGYATRVRSLKRHLEWADRVCYLLFVVFNSEDLRGSKDKGMEIYRLLRDELTNTDGDIDEFDFQSIQELLEDISAQYDYTSGNGMTIDAMEAVVLQEKEPVVLESGEEKKDGDDEGDEQDEEAKDSEEGS